MPRNIALSALFLLLLTGTVPLQAETLGNELRSANIPERLFSGSELTKKITSFAVANGDPYLLAYYDDDGSGILHLPLHVIRFDRATRGLSRADLKGINAVLEGQSSMDCLGSALSVQERRGTTFIETHGGPSAGCVIMLSPGLQFKTAVSGGLLGFLGDDAMIRQSEVHFLSVHPLHVAVFDLKRNRSALVYPFPNDPLRRQFSRRIEPEISEQWCVQFNAQCDPSNFDVDLQGRLVTNEAAGAFAFTAIFDAAGFGDAAEKKVPLEKVLYVFRKRGVRWEHREFTGRALRTLLDGSSVEELISRTPELPVRR